MSSDHNLLDLQVQQLFVMLALWEYAPLPMIQATARDRTNGHHNHGFLPPWSLKQLYLNDPQDVNHNTDSLGRGLAYTCDAHTHSWKLKADLCLKMTYSPDSLWYEP